MLSLWFLLDGHKLEPLSKSPEHLLCKTESMTILAIMEKLLLKKNMFIMKLMKWGEIFHGHP